MSSFVLEKEFPEILECLANGGAYVRLSYADMSINPYLEREIEYVPWVANLSIEVLFMFFCSPDPLLQTDNLVTASLGILYVSFTIFSLVASLVV